MSCVSGIIFLLIWLLFSVPALAQTSDPTQLKSMHPFVPTERISVDTDGKARELVALILAQYGLKLDEDRWDIWITEDGSDTPNAISTFIPATQKREIRFNRLFMEKIKSSSTTNWALLAVAAHEVGHHLANHVVNLSMPRKLAERQADYHAGFVLGRMGASYDETSNVIRWLPGTSENYPTRAQRLCEFGRGWRDATNKSPSMTASVNGKAEQFCDTPKDEATLTKFNMRVNRDIFGEDIAFTDGRAGLPGISLAECATRCDASPKCKAFSFDQWHGWCFLKGAIRTKTLDPPSLLGIKKSAAMPKDSAGQTIMERIPNKTFRDRPVEKLEQSSFDACRQHCTSKLRCVAFSFSKVTNTCSIFNSTEGYYFDERADSGYKRQEGHLNN